MREIPNISQRLLNWYDAKARQLPWRTGPIDRKRGILPDPYRVWISEIMLQQTTVVAVVPYYEKFIQSWPDIHSLAAAIDEDVMAAWAGLGYYSRARNLLKCARAVSQEFGGIFPSEVSELEKLPGIGPYTAAAISAIAFDQVATVVDGNVERVVSRLFAVSNPLPEAKKELRDLAASLTPSARTGDFAQAMMDLGATICTPRTPRCGACPIRTLCVASTKSEADQYPRRSPKRRKSTRFGRVYVGRRSDGAWLLERRPPQGLLGGMLGWPGSDWTDATTNSHIPQSGEWNELDAEVRHTFTHFHLRLRVHVGIVSDAPNDQAIFIQKEEFDPNVLPTVMRKAYDLALANGNKSI